MEERHIRLSLDRNEGSASNAFFESSIPNETEGDGKVPNPISQTDLTDEDIEDAPDNQGLLKGSLQALETTSGEVDISGKSGVILVC